MEHEFDIVPVKPSGSQLEFKLDVIESGLRDIERAISVAFANGERLGKNRHVRHEVLKNSVIPYALNVCAYRDRNPMVVVSAAEEQYFRGFIEGWWESFK